MTIVQTRSKKALPGHLEVLPIRSCEQIGPYADQLIDKSQQMHVYEHATAGARLQGPFVSSCRIDEWIGSGTVSASLLIDTEATYKSTDQNRVEAIGWTEPIVYHPSAVGRWQGFGIHMFSSSVGNGLSVPFAKVIHARTVAEQPDSVFLVEVPTANHTAISMFNSLGYLMVGSGQEAGTINMIYQASSSTVLKEAFS